MAGVGFSAVSTDGPVAVAATAAPVTPTLSVTPTDEADVPKSLASIDGAEQLAAVRQARSTAADYDSDSQICEVRNASVMTTALMEEEDRSDLLIFPMKNGTYRNTSGFGWRADPFTGLMSQHLGTDMAAPTGTPIYSVADGVVEHVGGGIDGRSDNLIIIRHEGPDGPYWSWYVHMWDDGLFVTEGQRVRAGDHIGAVGNNGNSTGPHLHFEIHVGTRGNVVSPLGFLAERQAGDVSELCG